jgi:hypothetical protein
MLQNNSKFRVLEFVANHNYAILHEILLIHQLTNDKPIEIEYENSENLKNDPSTTKLN